MARFLQRECAMSTNLLRLPKVTIRLGGESEASFVPIGWLQESTLNEARERWVKVIGGPGRLTIKPMKRT